MFLLDYLDYRKKIVDIASERSLPESGVEILLLLRDRGCNSLVTGITMGEINNVIPYRVPSTISGSVKKLRREGLVRTDFGDQSDIRKRHTYLLEKGSEIVKGFY